MGVEKNAFSPPSPSSPPTLGRGVSSGDFENVRDKFSDFNVLESMPRPGLRPEEVAPSGQPYPELVAANFSLREAVDCPTSNAG